VKTAERQAERGELCTCGRPAVTVYSTEHYGEIGWCGRSDGGRRGPCVFCGTAAGHDGDRCPAYVLQTGPRLDGPVSQSPVAPPTYPSDPGPEL
jgi:hypothetical protein